MQVTQLTLTHLIEQAVIKAEEMHLTPDTLTLTLQDYKLLIDETRSSCLIGTNQQNITALTKIVMCGRELEIHVPEKLKDSVITNRSHKTWTQYFYSNAIRIEDCKMLLVGEALPHNF